MKVLYNRQNTVSLVVETDALNKIILKLNSSYTIDQVLTTVCRKWDLLKDKHCVKLAGKKLKKSWTLTEANLMNGTCLKVTRDDDADSVRDSSNLKQVLVDIYLEDEELTITDKFNLSDSLWDVYTKISATRLAVWEEVVRMTCLGITFETIDAMEKTRLISFGEGIQRLYIRCFRTRLPWLNSSPVLPLLADEKTKNVGKRKAHPKRHFTFYPKTTELSERFGRIYLAKWENCEGIEEKVKVFSGGKRLKIHVPKDYVVEANFTASETVGDVISFVAKYTTCSSDKFYLCLKSPKIILEPEKKIQELKSLEQDVSSVWLVPVGALKKCFSFNGDTMGSLEGDNVKKIVSSASLGNYLSRNRSTMSKNSKYRHNE